MVDINQKATNIQLVSELGARKETTLDIFTHTEKSPEDIDRYDYRKMWQNDGQIAAIINLPKYLITGLGFDIISENEGTEYEFIKECLENSAHNGGMETPIQEVIEDMILFPFEGARYYELVFKNDRGLRLAKIASRDNLTCYPVSDENGNFKGFYQRVQFKDRFIEVFIPFDKSIALINNQAYGGLTGLSILKAAWYHWDKLHKLYFISHLAAELQTIPPKIVYQNAGRDVVNEVNRAVDELGLQGRVTVPMDAFKIETLEGSSPNVSILDLINHHKSQISKSLLAQWIDLGSEISKTGSRALGDPMITVYYGFLKGIISKIESVFNDVIIPKLIDANFATKEYPKLKFKPLTDEKKELITALFTETVKNLENDDPVKIEIIDQTMQELGLQFDRDEYEAIKEAKEAKSELMAQELDKMPAMEQQQDEDIIKKENDVELAESAKTDYGTTTLTLDEQRLDVMNTSAMLDQAVNQLKGQLSQEFLNQLPEVKKQIENAISSNNISLIGNIMVGSSASVVSAMTEAARKIYEKSKLGAYRELGQDAETTDAQQRQISTLNATTNGNDLVNKITNGVQNIIRAGVANSQSMPQIELAVANEMQKFLNTTLSINVDELINSTFNQARISAFKNYENTLWGYRYTAVLDNDTTDFCRSLNGKVFEVGSRELANITPPNHFRCRSTLTPILMADAKPKFYSGEIKSYGSLGQFKDGTALLAETEKPDPIMIKLKEIKEKKDIEREHNQQMTLNILETIASL